MKWVTRERPKIDRIACPWLIARFIDKDPQFLYVSSDQVLKVAAADTGAVPGDVPGAEMTHVGELQLRRLHEEASTRRASAAATGTHRLRHRHFVPGVDARVARAVRDLARFVTHVPGRPRDTAPRLGDV